MTRLGLNSNFLPLFICFILRYMNALGLIIINSFHLFQQTLFNKGGRGVLKERMKTNRERGGAKPIIEIAHSEKLPDISNSK